MNDRFGGCGSVLSLNSLDTQLHYRSYCCTKGLYEEEAIDMLRLFYTQDNPLAPKPLSKEHKRKKLEEAIQAKKKRKLNSSRSTETDTDQMQAL